MMFWFGIAKALLPIILRWIADAQRSKHMKEGEQRLIARQLAAFVEETGIWEDVQNEVRDAATRRAILTGSPVPTHEGTEQG